MTPQRKKVETLVLKVMDALDKSGKNTEYYQKLFAGMNDVQFKKYVSKDFPFIFQYNTFEIEPKMDDVAETAKVLDIPLVERVYLPYYYKNKDGVPVNSKPCYVVYLHLKKMKQFITKKNSMSVSIDDRDMKTGLLLSHDKNGKTSDREMEALIVMGLDSCVEEFSRPRADAMQDKSIMYNTINTIGSVSLKELPHDIDDSLSANLLNTYLLGSMIKSNIINEDYYLSKTIKGKGKKIKREY
jgi:hypothetical protein